MHLGRAQADKSLERSVFTSGDLHCVIFVPLEWLFKDTNLKIAKDAALAKTITLIAVDEVHLICEWQSFDLAIETWNQYKEQFSKHTAGHVPYCHSNLKHD